ncbi:phthiocerol/phthiodiolone dimycocerosyl transferase family protein [Amycolatopsis sp. PS_44_ISF1]|uniref:phthiocerol/phthiodiolone dimycocerosyl transferase family protein n=1 Tax=Amycolatopsis sp. PS_44_ISF1 TaxID=2974917 RepID=UPI0028DF36C8|nr:acyltransferase [Amycolatopsis sp. PS_44_ISF1]MDT8909753.1 acyltransferase [Amycolatopsis sp. PS_44_ISF1]
MTRAGIRALSPSERIHAVREAYIGYTVRVAGRPDPDALRTAFEAVYHAHPQLSARIEATSAGPALAESDVPPEIRFAEGDPGAPLAGIDFDQHRSLSALNVVGDGEETAVCLAVHHSVADAHHATALLSTLWSGYTDTIVGAPLDLPRQPYPRSLEDLLADRGIHPSAPGAPAAAPGPPPALPDPVVRPVVQHRLSPAETTALTDLGHREHVTINGLVSGVILLTEAELRDVPLTDLVHRYSVNLRDRVTPPIGATEGTNVLGGVGFRAPAEVEPDAVALGRAIGTGLRADLADGSVQRSVLDMFSRPAAAKPWDPDLARVTVSIMNWGVIPPMRTPGGLRLTNLHSASRMREPVAIGGYVLNTFGGRIGIDLVWPEDDPTLPARVDALRERLGHLLRAR